MKKIQTASISIFAVFAIVMALTTPTKSFAQSFELEWKVENGHYVGDLDGDGVGEIVQIDEAKNTTQFYDGKTHEKKWEINSLISGYLLQSFEPLISPLIDYNGDKIKEVVYVNINFFKIIDIVDGTVIFELTESDVEYGVIGLIDLDKDTILELMLYKYEYNNDNTTFLIYSTGVSAPTAITQSSQQRIPKTFDMSQNYPNPFNPTTAIEYEIKNSGSVNLEIYNSIGQKIKTLVSKQQNAGVYKIQWDGKDAKNKKVASGVYFYQIKIEGISQTKKMLLVK